MKIQLFSFCLVAVTATISAEPALRGLVTTEDANDGFLPANKTLDELEAMLLPPLVEGITLEDREGDEDFEDFELMDYDDFDEGTYNETFAYDEEDEDEDQRMLFAKLKVTAKEKMNVKFINNARKKFNRRPLFWAKDLAREAKRWSRVMAITGNFKHRNPLSKNLFNNWKFLGENIAQHWCVGIKCAHAMLMRSPGHRANILNGQFNRIGLGIYYHKKKKSYYVTQIFKQV